MYHAFAGLDLVALRFRIGSGLVEDLKRPRNLVVVVPLTAFVAHFWRVELSLDDSSAFFWPGVVEDGLVAIGFALLVC